MLNTFIDYILESLRITYFMEIPLFISFAFLAYRIKKSRLRCPLLTLYLSVACFTFLLHYVWFIFTLPAERFPLWSETANTILCFVEFLFFSKVFALYLNRKIAEHIRFVLCILFGLLACSFIYWSHTYGYRNRFAIENKAMLLNFSVTLALLLGATAVFIDLISKPISNKSGNFGIFWMTASFFVYGLAMMPFLLIGDRMHIIAYELWHAVYAIHFFTLALVFISLGLGVKTQRVIFSKMK
jgi:hypothetical protein